MSQVTCDCGRELSFAGVVVQQCPDCGRWVSAGAASKTTSEHARRTEKEQRDPAGEAVCTEVVPDLDHPSDEVAGLTARRHRIVDT